MNRLLRVLLLLMAAGALASGVAVAQEEETVADQESQPPTEEDGSPTREDGSPELDTIERILQQEQAIEEDDQLGYDPGSRRDPFRSLQIRTDRPSARGPRPEGVPGLLIDDVTVRGIFVTPRGPVAQVVASREDTSFVLREGDQLFDGEVVEIRFKKDEYAEIVFKQGVRDPAAIKPFREVVKRLNQKGR